VRQSRTAGEAFILLNSRSTQARLGRAAASAKAKKPPWQSQQMDTHS